MHPLIHFYAPILGGCGTMVYQIVYAMPIKKLYELPLLLTRGVLFFFYEGDYLFLLAEIILTPHDPNVQKFPQKPAWGKVQTEPSPNPEAPAEGRGVLHNREAGEGVSNPPA